METKFVGYKIQLYPTDDQKQIFTEYFGLARFIYNLALEIRENNYQDYLNGKSDIKYLSYIGIRNKITELRRTDEKYEWINKYNTDTICTCVKDLVNGYIMFSSGRAVNKPKFKCKKDFGNKMFPVRADRLVIKQNYVRLPSIGYIYAGNIPDKVYGSGDKNAKTNRYIKYVNPRVSYDGINYWISFEVETSIDDRDITYNSNYKYLYNDEYMNKPCNRAIGIDLGCSKNNWIVMSDGYRKSLPDFTTEEKKIRQLFRKSARQRIINLREERTNPTKNQIKTNRKINKYYKRIVNRRKSAIYDACKHILDFKPEAVVMENIYVKEIMSDYDNISKCMKQTNAFNHNIDMSNLFMVKNTFRYVLESNNIPFYLAPSDYPSTQICSCCGAKKNIGRSKTYKCDVCGSIINRDYNASVNLSNWYYLNIVNG